MTIANTNVIAKVAAVVAGLGLVFSSFAYAVPAKAATMEELQAQIAALMAQIAAMSGGSSTSAGAAFTADMTIGASGSEVTRLQNWLISKGYSIPAGATGYFGAQTAAAVAAYQTASGITPASGYFGPITRAKVNASGTTGGSTGGSTSGDLEGGAGAIAEADFLSSLSNEEVGEDAEDVEVAGLELQADEGSDIELTAVTIDFDYADTGGDDDLEDYATEVAIMLDGEEVARLDADEFNDDNDYSKTISLDDGAVIRADETGELVVAVSGLSNIEDTGENWNVAFEAVRFRDADGATISDTSTGDITDGNEDTTTDAGERQFSFESFASASDIELKVSLTDGDDADDINEAHTINVHATDDTDGVEILAFTLEADGDSDLAIDEIPVIFTSVEATGNDPDDLVTSATLFMDGEEVGSENFLTSDGDGSTETITFDDLDLTIDAGEEVDFTVEVDFVSLADVMDAGDTLKAEITATERAAMDVEDEAGEDLVSGDRTGTANGEASEVRDIGMMLEFVSSSASITTQGDPATAGASDIGTFTITFDVTAFDGDVYVDLSAPLAAGGSGEADLAVTGTGTVVSTITSPTGATAGTDGYLVDEDETERFAVTTSIAATADGFFAVELDNLVYALTDVDGTLSYTFNLDDFKTDQLFLNDN